LPLPPFDFRLTVRKPAGWDLFTSDEVYNDGTLWTGIRLGQQPIGLKIQSLGTIERPRLLVTAYSASELTAEESEVLGTLLPVCLGANQDLRGFYAFAMEDSILKHSVKSLYGMHDTQAFTLFNSVILSICLQMARLKRSLEMMHAIQRNYGEAVQFDGRSVPLQPTAERAARLKPEILAKRCKLGYRGRYIVGAAKMIAGGFPTMQEIMKMAPEEAKHTLTELPGVGDYAADIINPHAGFPIDAWSVDVFGLLFFGELPRNRREEIEKVKREGMKRWGRWSWMAFFYVAQDLQNLSKRLGIQLRME
jgi:3-methyladenine DNA glycosylase/8-oxoguanine DNA glycosylase